MFFMIYSFVLVVIFLFFTNGWTNTSLYILILLMGFGRGYWAVFVTISAEQFGTNLRATVATTVPNFVRGALIPITFLFNILTPKYLLPTDSAALLAILVFSIAFLSILTIEETFSKDLDYLELKSLSKSKSLSH
jgi:MFS transporter, putative metabolite:H+ symporter